MIRLRDVTFARGATRLVEHASLTVHAGQKVGVIGANGCGKSTLFALLRDVGDAPRRRANTCSTATPSCARSRPAWPPPRRRIRTTGT